MKTHIGLIAPYSEMIDRAEEIARKKNLRLTACCAVLENILPHARRMEIGGVDAIIVRQGSEIFLRKKINIPVVPVRSTCLDVLRAIAEARQESSKIAIANFMSNFTFLDFLKEILDWPLQDFVFERLEDAHQKIKKMAGSIDILVGGGLTTLIAEQYGIKSILIKSNDAEIEFAMDIAGSLVKTKQDEEQKLIRNSIIINHSTEGIIAVDQKQRITVYNKAAESIFETPYKEVIDKRNEVLLRKANLIDGKHDPSESPELIKIKGENYFMHAIPLMLNNVHFGKVAIYEGVARVQDMEKKYRLSLNKKGHVARITFDRIIGQSKVLKDTIAKARKFAKSDFTVLITGETGTGKEMFAQSIFNESHRNNGPFVPVNCGTLPHNLLEAELFGYEEGAFTGAKKGGKQGYFEIAHKGVIFLDEIGTMSPDLQTRLLRVLQEKEIVRIGGNSVIPVDIRVIAATNTNLLADVATGRFREDLFYRLNILNLHIPPLRERLKDISSLVDATIKDYKISVKNASVIKNALNLIPRDYQWRGNVRELLNIIAHLAVLLEDTSDITNFEVLSMIDDAMFQFNETAQHTSNEDSSKHIDSLDSAKRETEKRMFYNLLTQKNLTKTQAAEKLGISRTTLWRRCRKYNIL